MIEERDVDTSTPLETLEIRSLETMKVMADERRTQLVDLLRAGAATVKELAHTLNVPPKSLYYHINLLERHGLIRVVDTRVVSGIVEKRYRATAYLFLFHEFGPGRGPDWQREVFERLSSIIAMTRDELRVGLESGLVEVRDAAPAADRLAFAWNLTNLSARQRAELEERMERLLEEYSTDDEDGGDIRPYRYLFALYPTYRRGNRPVRPAQPAASGEPS